MLNRELIKPAERKASNFTLDLFTVFVDHRFALYTINGECWIENL